MTVVDQRERAGGLPGPPLSVRLGAAVARRMPRGRFRLMEWVARRAPGRFVARLSPELGGCAFECDLRDVVSREAYLTGRYEHQETAVFRALLRPGQTFVDVGANWGYFTLLASHLVGPRGRVIALEPDPRMLGVLAGNLARNGLRESVTLLGVAASDAEAEVTLSGFDDSGGNYGTSHLQAGGPAGRSFRVAARPLDDVLDEQGVADVDLLKMDIEGAETLALPGLRRSLDRGRIRRLLIELHLDHFGRFGRSKEDVLGLLEGRGYRAWTWDGSFEANRRAAYARALDAASLLRPLDPRALPPEARFHTLWVAPGIESPLPV